jgi:hypothetical protein
LTVDDYHLIWVPLDASLSKKRSPEKRLSYMTNVMEKYSAACALWFDLETDESTRIRFLIKSDTSTYETSIPVRNDRSYLSEAALTVREMINESIQNASISLSDTDTGGPFPVLLPSPNSPSSVL